jgi:hypothetical protein
MRVIPEMLVRELEEEPRGGGVRFSEAIRDYYLAGRDSYRALVLVRTCLTAWTDELDLLKAFAAESRDEEEEKERRSSQRLVMLFRSTCSLLAKQDLTTLNRFEAFRSRALENCRSLTLAKGDGSRAVITWHALLNGAY